MIDKNIRNKNKFEQKKISLKKLWTKKNSGKKKL